MATTTTTFPQFTFDDASLAECGIRRMMTEDEYEGEFLTDDATTPTTTTATNEEEGTTTPRPGTSKTENDAAARAASRAVWTFSQAAKASAMELKRRRSLTSSRTDYRMGANLAVRHAFCDLEKKHAMTEADFNLLKQAIGNFRVRIVVHDSITIDELKEMQVKCAAELSESTVKVNALDALNPSFMATSVRVAAFAKTCREKHEDLVELNRSITMEIYQMKQKNERVPSQHAQIAHSSGITLQNILSGQTIRRRFLSLNALTRAIRSDLVAFLTNDARGSDRAIVVQQIKDSCTAAKKKTKAAITHH
jgi:hypothetical protein